MPPKPPKKSLIDKSNNPATPSDYDDRVITVGLLTSIIDDRLKDLELRLFTKIDGLRTEIETMKATVNEVREENISLKQSIDAQQIKMIDLEVTQRQCNMVISGVPEDGVSDQQRFVHIHTAMHNKDSVAKEKFGIPKKLVDVVSMRRIGVARKQDGVDLPKLLMVTFRDRADRDLYLRASKILKYCDNDFKNIYFQPDYPAILRKAHGKLRAKMKEVVNSKLYNRVYIKKNCLYGDDIVIDKLDIASQLPFRDTKK